MKHKKYRFLLLAIIIGFSFILITPNQEINDKEINNRDSEDNLRTSDQSVILNFNTPEKNHTIVSIFYNYTIVVTIVKPEPIFNYGVPNITIYQNETLPIVDWIPMNQINSSDSWNYTIDPIDYNNGNYTLKVRCLDYIGFGYNQTEIYILNNPPHITFINLSPLCKIHRINEPYFNINASVIDPEGDPFFSAVVLIMDINDTIVLGWSIMENAYGDYYNYTFDPINYDLGYYTIWIGVMDDKTQNYGKVSIIIYEVTSTINLLNPNGTDFYLNKKYPIKCSISNDFEIVSVKWDITSEIGNHNWNYLIYNISSGYWENIFYGIDYSLGVFYLVINVTDEFGLSFSYISPIVFLEEPDINGNGNPNDPLEYLFWILLILTIIIIGILGSIFLIKKSSKKYVIPSKIPKKISKKVITEENLLNTPEMFKGYVDTVNLLISDGLKANEEGDHKKAIKFWNMSIKQLQKVKKEINRLDILRPQLLIDIDDQISILAINIQNAWEKEKSKVADYFLNITSIHAVMIIHIEQCSCLAKINYHLGQGIDETLFSAFLSAIIGFKTEIGNKMGLTQKEKKTNILAFNTFNITLLDGAFIRLGIVSDDSLDELIIKKAFGVIDKYENIHYETLKYFNGSLAPYRDFPQLIDNEFDLSLNRKSSIDIDNFIKSSCPPPIKIILRRLFDNKESFYPAKLWDIIMRDAKLSKKDAIYQTYDLFQEKVFYPIEDIPKSEDTLYPTEEEKEIENKEE